MQMMPVIRALHLFALAVLAGGFSFAVFVLPASAAAEPVKLLFASAPRCVTEPVKSPPKRT